VDNKEREDNLDAWQFIQGQKDCKYGLPQKEDEGLSYDRGYSAEYHLQAMLDYILEGVS
jgi:hypothetical protein